MNKAKALQNVAGEIARCPFCKKGGSGTVVPGEGNPLARVVFVGEAPGKEEAKIGRPFIGRSGKFLRQMIREIGLAEDDVFITSPGHYLPLRGTPSKETIIHGREHLFKQLEIIEPKIIVLLGNTACLAMLDRKMGITKDHGTVIERNGRKHLVTFHPAYAMRFPEGKRQFMNDFQKLKKLLSRLSI
ncbi:MAG: uracil-DNA glycosylase [Betaproteobacteria bacterium]